MSLRLPACPSLEEVASRDLGSAEYCRSRRTFAAEFICIAVKIGSLLPSSRLDGLALLCTKEAQPHRHFMRALRIVGRLLAAQNHAGSSMPRATLELCWEGSAPNARIPPDGSGLQGLGD